MKHEARSTKSETNSKNKKFKTGNGVSNFGIWNLRFVSNFEFRISNFHQSKSRGFTLMEMVVSLGIFSVVMLLAIGALVSVQNAQIRASDAQIAHNNIRFAVELMTKEIRQGRDYAGYAGGILQSDCSSGCTELRFTRTNGERFGYCLNAGKLVRFNAATQSCSAASAAVLTAEESSVDGLLFYVVGQDLSPADGQARVTIAMRVLVRSPSQRTETVMNLQTTVVQRLREG